MTDILIAIAIFSAWSVCASGIGWWARVVYERRQYERLHDRLWPEIERQIQEDTFRQYHAGRTDLNA